MLRIRAAFAAIVIASAAGAAAQAPSLKLIGLDGATKTVTVTELQALPQVEVADSSAEAGRLIFRGPTVRSVVSLIGAPEGRALGPSMPLRIAMAGEAHRARWIRQLTTLRVARVQ